MKWSVWGQGTRRVVVEAAVWYEARERGAAMLGRGSMDLHAEPVERRPRDEGREP
jgi:hypothetical protein